MDHPLLDDRNRPVARILAALCALAVAVAAFAAAPPAVAQEAGVPVDRIFGSGRVETAVAISAQTFDSADTVVVARADGFADALAGGPLASAVGGPVLLASSTDDLTDGGVLDEIERLGAEEVVVLGGDDAVPTEVADALGDIATVRRIDGRDRYATAQQIAAELDAATDVSGVVVVRGTDFPDAVSASWWAGQQGLAILPVRTDGLPAGTLETIADIGATAVTIVGGTNAVGTAVEEALAAEDLELTVDRLAGADRYETSAVVWNAAVAQGADPAQRWFATGAAYPDALSAAPAVAAAGYTFALVPPTSIIASLPIAAVVSGSADELERVVVLGGEEAVQPSTVEQIQAATSDAALTAQPADYCLTVLHNNDGESQLPYSSSSELFGGIARFASVVERERTLAAEGFAGDGCAERQSILLNSGDNYLPSPEFAASRDNDFNPFYDAVGLRQIGYDAFAVGNHEFDFGPEVLDTFIAAIGDTPFVSANLEVAGTALEGDIVPSVTVEKGSRTIGIVGATTPALPTISSPGEVTVQSLEATIDTVNAEAARLREEDGADIVILQSHLQDIDEDIALIGQTTGIDIAIAGGGDELLGEYGNLYVPDDAGVVLPAAVGPDDELPGIYPVPASNADGTIVPVVTTTGDYRYVGRLRARFGADGALVDTVPVDARRSRLVRVAAAEAVPDGVEPDATIQEQVVEPVLEYTQGLSEVIVATTEVGLNGVRGDVRTRQTNVGSLLTDSYIRQVELNGAAAGLDTAQPVVAIANGGGIRNDSVIAEGGGEISAQDTFDIAPFNNTVVAFDGVTADQLKALLERGYSGLPDAAGQFAQVGGMTVEVDPTQTAQVVSPEGAITTPGARVRSVTLTDGTPVVVDGTPVDGAPEVVLATVNFTAAGGDNYPFADVGLAGDAFVQLAPSYQQSLQELLDELGTVSTGDYPQFPDRIVIGD